MTVPSGSAVTADFRCSTRDTSTGTARRPYVATTRPSCRMPSSLVRPPRPTYIVSPTFSTSPQVERAGGLDAVQRQTELAHGRLDGHELGAPRRRSRTGQHRRSCGDDHDGVLD